MKWSRIVFLRAIVYTYEVFDEILRKTVWESCSKVRKVFEKVKSKKSATREREKKVVADYKHIVEDFRLKRMCEMSDNPALARLMIVRSFSQATRGRKLGITLPEEIYLRNYLL